MDIFRDRDYIKDSHGDIYQVIGSLHPDDWIMALQKYRRVKADEIKPLKAELASSTNPLENVKPHPFRIWVQKTSSDRYARILPNYSSIAATENCEGHPYAHFSSIFGKELLLIPPSQVQVHYRPELRLQELMGLIEHQSLSESQKLDSLERMAIEVVLTLKQTFGIPLSDMGVTGSILWNAQHEMSDIDVMVYGLENTEKICLSSTMLPETGAGLRRYRKIEIYPLAQKMSIKSGLSLEDCFIALYVKKYLMFFGERKVSITFAPKGGELLHYPLFNPETQFEVIGPCRVIAEIKSDIWGMYYPGLFEVKVTEILHFPAAIEESMAEITRLLIYEHEFVGYYREGDRVEIKGLLQRARNVPSFASVAQSVDTYQILVGGTETFGNEYVRVPADINGG